MHRIILISVHFVCFHLGDSANIFQLESSKWRLQRPGNVLSCGRWHLSSSWFHAFYSHKPITSRVLCVNMAIVSQANIGGWSVIFTLTECIICIWHTMGSLRLPDFLTDQVFLLSKVCKLNCYTSPFFRWVGTNSICTTNLQSPVYSHWLTQLSLILVSVLSTRHITVSTWSIPAAECRGVIWWEQLINMVHNERPGSLAYSSLLACKQLASYFLHRIWNVTSYTLLE